MRGKLASHNLSFARAIVVFEANYVNRVSGSITISELAKLAGVSTATVSRVFNRAKNGFSKVTETRVRAVIRSMDWMPNEDAQILGRRNSNKPRKRRSARDEQN